MTKKYTPEDLVGLRLDGEDLSKRLEAAWEFCDILNSLAAMVDKWRERHAAIGSGKPQSLKLQAKNISSIIDPK